MFHDTRQWSSEPVTTDLISEDHPGVYVLTTVTPEPEPLVSCQLRGNHEQGDLLRLSETRDLCRDIRDGWASHNISDIAPNIGFLLAPFHDTSRNNNTINVKVNFSDKVGKVKVYIYQNHQHQPVDAGVISGDGGSSSMWMTTHRRDFRAEPIMERVR